jgi:hypothetical protein
MNASATSTSAPPPGSELQSPELIAYRVTPWPDMKLIRAPRARDWMDSSQQHVANRCLPLLIANQSGWWVLNNQPIRATWTGGWDRSCVRIECLDGAEKCSAAGHFGEGVLTFILPFLFRTSPGFNLHVRGPANLQKDGIAPLEGIVETDWSVATFTMNWRFTRPHHPVVFEKDEPICMVVPQPRGLLEKFTPVIRDIRSEPLLEAAYANWHKDRTRFLNHLKTTIPKAMKDTWQKHYFRGVHLSGAEAPEHQVKLELRDFTEQPFNPPPRSLPPIPRVSPKPIVSLPTPKKKFGRNDPCPCGSGKKFKKCCMPKE